MTETKTHDIAIIGAGLGGLTLLRILKQQGIDAVLFERDPSRSARHQGGTLDLHRDSGQLAVAAAGLEAEFRRLARPENQGMRIMDKAGNLLWEDSAENSDLDRPEIDRSQLRDLLLNAQDPDSLCWGYRLTSMEPILDGGHLLHFDNGVTVRAKIVVGADGARSKVRSTLTPVCPVYSGVSFIETTISQIDSRFPSLAAAIGQGTFMALADNKGLIAQRNASGQTRLYIALGTDDNDLAIATIPFSRPAEARQAIESLFSDWSTTLTALIVACDAHFTLRHIDMLPVGLRWESHPSITLIGDAAHLMSPFAGEGANQAMLDAAELAKALMASPTAERAIRHYENAMFSRSTQAAAESADNLERCFAPEGAHNLARQMAAYSTAHSNAQPDC